MPVGGPKAPPSWDQEIPFYTKQVGLHCEYFRESLNQFLLLKLQECLPPEKPSSFFKVTDATSESIVWKPTVTFLDVIINYIGWVYPITSNSG